MDSKTVQKILKKVKKDYSLIAKEFSITRERIWNELNLLVENYTKDNQNILDIGCGNGRLFSILKDKNINYLGVDNCKELIDIAKEKYKDYDNSKFEIKDLLGINFKREFDVVFVIAVLQHIPSEKLRLEALKKIKNALKPNGYLIMLNWNFFNKTKKEYIKKQKNSNLDLDKNDLLIPWKATKDKVINRYYHAFTKEEIVDLLKRAGFEIEDIYYVKKGERSDVEGGYNICTVAKNT